MSPPQLCRNHGPRIAVLVVAAFLSYSHTSLAQREEPTTSTSSLSIPQLHLPDPRIAAVYEANWRNTLLPCTQSTTPADIDSPHSEPLRPWKVDVGGHYPGWYPGVDMKHMAAAYLACGKDLPLVLRAWDLTADHYMQADGAIHSSTMKNNPQGTWPEATADATHLFYPLRTVGTIDFMLLGHQIFCYSQDRAWLQKALPKMRKSAAFLRAWIDPSGVLHSDSYDLDQVFRHHDGVAQASACLAFRRLAQLESVAGNQAEAKKAAATADLLACGAQLFWDKEKVYFHEHLVYNNLLRTPGVKFSISASSTLSESHHPGLVADGVYGIGVDAFGVGLGSAGKHEWAAKDENTGAWLEISFDAPVMLTGVVAINRTDHAIQPSERFATAILECDEGEPVELAFNSLIISRAVAMFPARKVRKVRFTGREMQAAGGGSGGLAELVILGDSPYLPISHGLTDTNLAMAGFGIADEEQTASLWQLFRKTEDRYYQVGDLRAPTWISPQAETYTPEELNRRAPRKDCVAMGRTWRYDALCRKRQDDGEGLYRTLQDALALFDRPSGGGVGFYAERYGLGKFQPGDESQANVPKYSEYPAVMASTVIQECLLGATVDAAGIITLSPCVPEDWYRTGFGAEGLGLLAEHDITFAYQEMSLRGTLAGPTGKRTLQVRLPPELREKEVRLTVGGKMLPHQRNNAICTFTLEIEPGKPTPFELTP